MLNNSISKAFYFLILSALSTNALADIITNTATCTESTATLNSIYVSNYDISDGLSGGATGINLLNQTYNATSCIGLFDGNDSQVPALGNNIGQYGDGLLNGAEFFNGPYSGDQLSGLEFITLDDLQDVDGDGDDFPGPGVAEGRDDPGWIELANFENADLSTSETNPNYYNWLNVNELAISDVLRLSFSCNNNCSQIDWTLKTDKDIVASVQDILGESTFDHLAFSIKSANSSDEETGATGGWGVYDFNFKEIFLNEINNGNPAFNDPSAFTTAFILGGTLDLGYDFHNANGQARSISHLTVFARDPADTPTQIPEPSTVAIFGFSLLLLSVRKLRIK